MAKIRKIGSKIHSQHVAEQLLRDGYVLRDVDGDDWTFEHPAGEQPGFYFRDATTGDAARWGAHLLVAGPYEVVGLPESAEPADTTEPAVVELKTKAEAFVWLGQNPGKVLECIEIGTKFRYSDEHGLEYAGNGNGDPVFPAPNAAAREWGYAKGPFQEVATEKLTDEQILERCEEHLDPATMRALRERLSA